MLTVKDYILTCYTFMCCFEVLVFSDKIEEIERTKNMSVFMKESEQILSNLRDNLRKSKETLDRLALDSEIEELLRDNEARQVEEIGAQLDVDFLRQNDKAKLIRSGNSNEPLRSNSLLVSLKSNKRALQDILTSLLPSNLRNSEALSDGLNDHQSNFFGIGGSFSLPTTATPTPAATEQSILLRTIMRAPPPLPKHVGISRVHSNGSIVCFSVIQVCPTIPSTGSTKTKSDNTLVSINSDMKTTQSSVVSSTQPSSLLPYEVYLNNQDIGLEESTSSEYEGNFKQSISFQQRDSGNLFQNSENAVSPDVLPTYDVNNLHSKLPLDKAINTFLNKEINKTNHNSTLYKLFFGGKENSIESTSTSASLSTTRRKKKYKFSNLFENLATGTTNKTTGTMTPNTNNTTGSTIKSVNNATASSIMQHANNTITGSTMKNANNPTTGSTMENANNPTTGSTMENANNPTTGSTMENANNPTTGSTTQSNSTTAGIPTGSTMKIISNDDNLTTHLSSNTTENQTTPSTIESTTASSVTTTCYVTTIFPDLNASTFCTESTETCPNVTCITEVEGSTTELTTNGSTTRSETSTIENRSEALKESENKSTTVSNWITTTTGKPKSTSGTTDLPTSTKITPKSVTTKKSNFFMKMLYYQPNKHHKHLSSTPISLDDSVPFQLFIIEPKILELPKLNGTAFRQALTSKP